MKTVRGRSRLVSDYDSNSIHVVTSEGTVRTLCDNGQEGFEDGQGTVSHLVSDYGSNSIRVVTSEGTVHTMCGNGQEGFEDGQGTVTGNGEKGFADGEGEDTRFNQPIGIVVDRQGAITVADNDNNRLRKIV